MTKRKFYQKKRWILPFAIIAIPTVIISITNQFTPVLSAAIMKQLFEAQTFASPKNMETIKQNVVVKKILYITKKDLIIVF